MVVSQVQNREAGDRWAGAGPDGTFLRREGAHSSPSQPHLSVGPWSLWGVGGLWWLG